MEIKKNQVIDNIEPRLLIIRNQPVLLDRDVAAIYGVETRRINEAVRRNIEKFPVSYRFPLQNAEIQQLVANCDRFKTLKLKNPKPLTATKSNF